MGGDSPSGRGLLTLEIDTSNGDLPNGERREYLKPIMFSGGMGQLDDRHLHKGQPEKDMLVVKVGGPAYRIALPHRYTTSLYHLAIPHRSTTSVSAAACPTR